jgi:lysophospholipase
MEIGIDIGLDGRVQGNGNMSGFLQANTYISGLSGGGWLVGPIAVHDFATIDIMRNDYWHLQDNLVAPAGLQNKTSFYSDLYHEVGQKIDAGFETYIRSPQISLILEH